MPVFDAHFVTHFRDITCNDWNYTLTEPRRPGPVMEEGNHGQLVQSERIPGHLTLTDCDIDHFYISCGQTYQLYQSDVETKLFDKYVQTDVLDCPDTQTHHSTVNEKSMQMTTPPFTEIFSINPSSLINNCLVSLNSNNNARDRKGKNNCHSKHDTISDDDCKHTDDDAKQPTENRGRKEPQLRQNNPTNKGDFQSVTNTKPKSHNSLESKRLKEVRDISSQSNQAPTTSPNPNRNRLRSQNVERRPPEGTNAGRSQADRSSLARSAGDQNKPKELRLLSNTRHLPPLGGNTKRDISKRTSRCSSTSMAGSSGSRSNLGAINALAKGDGERVRFGLLRFVDRLNSSYGEQLNNGQRMDRQKIARWSEHVIRSAQEEGPYGATDDENKDADGVLDQNGTSVCLTLPKVDKFRETAKKNTRSGSGLTRGKRTSSHMNENSEDNESGDTKNKLVTESDGKTSEYKSSVSQGLKLPSITKVNKEVLGDEINRSSNKAINSCIDQTEDIRMNNPREKSQHNTSTTEPFKSMIAGSNSETYDEKCRQTGKDNPLTSTKSDFESFKFENRNEEINLTLPNKPPTEHGHSSQGYPHSGNKSCDSFRASYFNRVPRIELQRKQEHVVDTSEKADACIDRERTMRGNYVDDSELEEEIEFELEPLCDLKRRADNELRDMFSLSYLTDLQSSEVWSDMKTVPRDPDVQQPNNNKDDQRNIDTDIMTTSVCEELPEDRVLNLQPTHPANVDEKHRGTLVFEGQARIVDHALDNSGTLNDIASNFANNLTNNGNCESKPEDIPNIPWHLLARANHQKRFTSMLPLMSRLSPIPELPEDENVNDIVS